MATVPNATPAMSRTTSAPMMATATRPGRPRIRDAQVAEGSVPVAVPAVIGVAITGPRAG